MTKPPLDQDAVIAVKGSVLDAQVPEFSEQAARQVAEKHYNLSGRLRRLTSERDVNWLLETAQGAFVLKLANPAEDLGVTQFQAAVLRHLAPLGLPVPWIVESLQGQMIQPTDFGRVRLLTYLPGRLMHHVDQTAGLRRAVAVMSARLALGLRGFDHPAADHFLQWDVRHTARLLPMLPSVPGDLFPDIEPFVRSFDRRFALQLAGCRWQVLHNDLNPHNVLVGADGRSVSGVLDFGDMVKTPLICDLGVTCSYQADPENLLASIIDFARAYHQILPLTRSEVALILPMTLARWITTVVITAHRAARYPENAPYILRNVPQARAGIIAMRGIDMQAAINFLLQELDPQ